MKTSHITVIEDGIELRRNLTVINTITQLEIMESEINVKTPDNRYVLLYY